MLQDMKKVFNSVSLRSLELAIQRIKVPRIGKKFIMALFDKWQTRIITAIGLTEPITAGDGIEQGEVISPLLWVIYIDPLLTMLNKINPSPYRIDSDPSLPPVETSSLCYMDDTNLFATFSDALTIMLNFAQEFYNFNNTKINFNKAVFICNWDPQNNDNPLPLVPSSYTFDITDNNFDITSILNNDSFRYELKSTGHSSCFMLTRPGSM